MLNLLLELVAFEPRPPAEFFELKPFLRSAMLGSLIPATAIASGHVLVGQAEVLGKFFLQGWTAGDLSPFRGSFRLLV